MKEKKIIMITQNMMMENPSTPNHFASPCPDFSAMNNENKKQDKIGLSLQKTFSSPSQGRSKAIGRWRKILNNKKKFPFEMHYTLFNSKRIERKWDEDEEKN